MNITRFLAALTGFLIVVFGAFGAHALEDVLTDKARDWWETASLYGLVHAGVALFLSMNKAPRAALAMILGTLLFSGSLYAMALGAPTWLGMVTPFGGLCFLAGWAMAGIGAFTEVTRSRH